jgi:hypothetical protein
MKPLAGDWFPSFSAVTAGCPNRAIGGLEANHQQSMIVGFDEINVNWALYLRPSQHRRSIFFRNSYS